MRRPRPGQLDRIIRSHFDGVAVRVPLTPEEGENEDEGHPAEPAIDEARSADRWTNMEILMKTEEDQTGR